MVELLECEADRRRITVTEADINELVETFAAQNQLCSVDELRAFYDAAIAQQEVSGPQSEQEIPPSEDVRDQLEQPAAATQRGEIVEQFVADRREQVDIAFFV